MESTQGKTIQKIRKMSIQLLLPEYQLSNDNTEAYMVLRYEREQQ